MVINKNLTFLNNINLKKLLLNFLELINFCITHIYFYVIMFSLQIILVLLYILTFFFTIVNNLVLLSILKILYFIHGIFSIVIIIDDYIFNKLIKIIFINVYYLISIKLFIIMFTIFI